MASWNFLTAHARTMFYIAGHPEARLRDIAASLGLTERTVTAITRDLTEAGYVIKHREGRRNRYEIRQDLPLHDLPHGRPTIGRLIETLRDTEPAAGSQAVRDGAPVEQ